ncbi:MAG: GNAT family N-acetyltransferase [Burkholderiaceae bacterium]
MARVAAPDIIDIRRIRTAAIDRGHPMNRPALPPVQDNPAEHRFELSTQDQLAIAEYKLAGNVIAFTHTEVPQALQGQGVGTHLVRAGLDAARTRGLRVVPKCSMFEGYMRKHPETHELLADEGRAMLGL